MGPCNAQYKGSSRAAGTAGSVRQTRPRHLSLGLKITAEPASSGRDISWTFTLLRRASQGEALRAPRSGVLGCDDRGDNTIKVAQSGYKVKMIPPSPKISTADGRPTLKISTRDTTHTGTNDNDTDKQ